MKNKRLVSNRFYLFAVIGSFSLILLISFFIYLYSVFKTNLYDSKNRELNTIINSTSSSIEDRLNSMSNISMNIVYSNSIISKFKDLSDTYPNATIDEQAMIKSRTQLAEIADYVFAMIGAFQTASQINIYSLDGLVAKTGYGTVINQLSKEEIPWYEDTLLENGKKYLSNPLPHDDIPSYSSDKSIVKYISLTRLFFDKSSIPEGFVEVVQDCREIFSFAIDETNDDNLKILVFNSRNEQVFPFDNTKNEITISDLNIVDGIISTKDGTKYLAKHNNLEKYDWNIYVLAPKNVFDNSIKELRSQFIIIIEIFLLLILMVCFFISKRLTNPINNLKKITEKTNLKNILEQDLDLNEKPKIKIKEIDELWQSYYDMRKTIKDSSQEILLLKSEEIKTNLLLSQSFVHPHFLYNTISTLSVMAEENMNEEIVSMCASLTRYLRYISNTESMLVPINEEAENIRNYLNIMQSRFSNTFTYSIDYTEETKNTKIPKLITQPIVENAFKYSFTKRPPWKLNIEFKIENNYWIVEIKDNGGNFKQEDIDQLLDTYKNLIVEDELKNMHIGGFGLKNIYLRLKMRYQNDFIFDIKCNYNIETVFKIGGKIE